jgi:Domain of unknown function (DUF4861)
MKSFKFLLCFAFIFPTFFWAQNIATITIQNNSALTRKEAVVSIKWETILSKYPQIDTTNFIVINPKTKKQLPFQLEHQGLKKIQNLLVQVDVNATSTLSLSIQKGKPEIFETKTYARFVPERKDDFAWENDHIAFRTYGKAIENTKEDAYGIDIWVKRTKKMIVNERYKLGDYHVDHGNGMDYYHVGHSLGAGNMAPFVKDTIRYSGNYYQWKVLDNGPLRTSFKLSYDTWNAGGIKVKATKTISLDAGSRLNRIENVYSYEGGQPLPVVVGIIKRPETGIISLNEQQGILGYWEPTHGVDGTTAVGSILLTPVNTMWVDTTQLLAKTFVKNNEPVVYYTGGAWDKEGDITNAKAWFNYLDVFFNELKAPLIVNVK